MALALIVALVLGGLGVYVAYQNPKLGAALLVGLGIVTVLYIIWDKDPTVFETGNPSSSTVPAATSPPPWGLSASPTTSGSASPPGTG
ncbi:hypothetical protein ACKI14_44925 [Streptomyces turgidiscabies]|uniref:hypothetical protein n=1 Tax=Streptomyces turgidiscabies TaxID=85558 RepID=UPI0038F6B27A